MPVFLNVAADDVDIAAIRLEDGVEVLGQAWIRGVGAPETVSSYLPTGQRRRLGIETPGHLVALVDMLGDRQRRRCGIGKDLLVCRDRGCDDSDLLAMRLMPFGGSAR